MTYLPDVNVWIALSAERHMFCLAAKNWFGSLNDEKLSFCRVTQMGFLRLLTNPHVMKDEVMNPGDARELSEEWTTFTEGKKTSPNLWTDAYQCAFAHAARATLVRFDAKIPTRLDVPLLVLRGIS